MGFQIKLLVANYHLYTYYNTLNLLNVSYLEWKGETNIGVSNELHFKGLETSENFYIEDLEMICCAQIQPISCLL